MRIIRGIGIFVGLLIVLVVAAGVLGIDDNPAVKAGGTLVAIIGAVYWSRPDRRVS